MRKIDAIKLCEFAIIVPSLGVTAVEYIQSINAEVSIVHGI